MRHGISASSAAAPVDSRQGRAVTRRRGPYAAHIVRGRRAAAAAHPPIEPGADTEGRAQQRVKSEGRIEAVDHAGDAFESAGERHREAGRGFAVPCIGFDHSVKTTED
jgi:hypothetical protein